MIRLQRSLALLVSLFATSAFAEVVQISSPHLGEGKTLRAQFFVPPAKSDLPRPAAILLHGCGGIGAKGELNPRHAMWRDWYLERGYAVLFPESFTSRGFEQICTQKIDVRTITQRDRVKDVAAARAWLIQQTAIDAKRLVLMGWSNGGGTVLASVVRSEPAARSDGDVPALPERAFAQAIAFYPGCSGFDRSSRKHTLNTPLSIFIGEADDWTPSAPCDSWAKRLRAAKQPVSITVYPGAYHDFDAPNIRHRVRAEVPNGVNPGKGVTVAPDPLARELAKKEVELLLQTPR